MDTSLPPHTPAVPEGGSLVPPMARATGVAVFDQLDSDVSGTRKLKRAPRRRRRAKAAHGSASATASQTAAVASTLVAPHAGLIKKLAVTTRLRSSALQACTERCVFAFLQQLTPCVTELEATPLFHSGGCFSPPPPPSAAPTYMLVSQKAAHILCVPLLHSLLMFCFSQRWKPCCSTVC